MTTTLGVCKNYDEGHPMCEEQACGKCLSFDPTEGALETRIAALENIIIFTLELGNKGRFYFSNIHKEIDKLEEELHVMGSNFNEILGNVEQKIESHNHGNILHRLECFDDKIKNLEDWINTFDMALVNRAVLKDFIRLGRANMFNDAEHLDEYYEEKDLFDNLLKQLDGTSTEGEPQMISLKEAKENLMESVKQIKQEEKEFNEEQEGMFASKSRVVGMERMPQPQHRKGEAEPDDGYDHSLDEQYEKLKEHGEKLGFDYGKPQSTEEWCKIRFRTWAEITMNPETHMTVWEMLQAQIEEYLTDLRNMRIYDEVIIKKWEARKIAKNL